MAVQEGYSPRNRAERVISAGRLFLALFLSIALVLEPNEVPASAPLYSLTFWYLCYAIAIAVLTWNRGVTARGVPVITHVIDLALFSVFMHLTESSTSPFFVYFVFAMICGAIRWHGRGALLTGAAVLALYIALTVGAATLYDTDVHTGRFVSRCTHLAIVAGLLAYLGAYQHRLQREIAGLAAWPRRLPAVGSDAIQEVLTYAEDVLRSPRMVLTWTEGEEPSLRVAIKAGESFESTREPPDAFGTIVAEALSLSSFACADSTNPRCDVLQRVPGGFRFWKGAPLDQKFQDRYQVKSVLSLRLSTDTIDGRLFALDRSGYSADDLLLGDVVGRLVAGALEAQALVEQLREGAAGEERLRLARELHDGVLQSLTAASLHVQRARQAIKDNRADAEQRLATVEETILAEHQALRLAIADLQPGAAIDRSTVDVVKHVREAATRVARQWDVRVHLNLHRDIPPLPPRMVHEICRMVQEAVVNAIRHGSAREVTVTCIASGPRLLLAVSYEGRGFVGFRGRYDLSALNEMKAGPRTLKERVSALNGSLEVESGDRGARVEIGIPLTQAR
jgi:signal transduction histidine kinase